MPDCQTLSVIYARHTPHPLPKPPQKGHEAWHQTCDGSFGGDLDLRKMNKLFESVKNKVAQIGKVKSPRIPRGQKKSATEKDPDLPFQLSSQETTGPSLLANDRLRVIAQALVDQSIRFAGELDRRGKSYAIAITLLICAFTVSDIVGLGIQSLIPDISKKPSTLSAGQKTRQKTALDFRAITDKNLFHALVRNDAGGFVPGPASGTPTLSSLPFSLVGILVMVDEKQSIATLLSKSNSGIVHPVRIQDEVPNEFRVTQITSEKVFIVNLRTNSNEYFQLPKSQGTAPVITPTMSTGAPNVQRSGSNRFTIPRAEIEKQMANINQILTQARAIPYMKNGKPGGFRLIQIQPGSIYETLGFKNNDVITAVNGEPIRDMADAPKVFEYMQNLGDITNMEITIERGDQPQTNFYDIN